MGFDGETIWALRGNPRLVMTAMRNSESLLQLKGNIKQIELENDTYRETNTKPWMVQRSSADPYGV